MILFWSFLLYIETFVCDRISVFNSSYMHVLRKSSFGKFRIRETLFLIIINVMSLLLRVKVDAAAFTLRAFSSFTNVEVRSVIQS